MKIITTIIPAKLLTNSLYLYLRPFLNTKSKNQILSKDGGLVTRDISVFCLKQVAFYFKAMPNLIDFNEEVFLHDISTNIVIVPCS